MGKNKQKGQEAAAVGETAGKKKFQLTFGKVLALAFGAVVVVYLFFSIHLFYNFIKIMITNPDAAKQQDAAVEALDEIYTDEEE